MSSMKKARRGTSGLGGQRRRDAAADVSYAFAARQSTLDQVRRTSGMMMLKRVDGQLRSVPNETGQSYIDSANQQLAEAQRELRNVGRDPARDYRAGRA